MPNINISNTETSNIEINKTKILNTKITNVEISKMELDDLKQIENCLPEDFDDFWSASILKQELENKQNVNSYYFVAKEQDKIVGFTGIILVLDEVSILNIVVRKNKRKCGIGSLLLNYIISFSKQKNAKSITLEVNENNLPAIRTL